MTKEESNRIYYAKNTQRDTVSTYCDYCQTEHIVLRKSYEKNTEKNGRYVCERYGGYLSGSKQRKENPYASEGKKQCTRCDLILATDGNFSKRKAASDGYESSCKKCIKDAQAKTRAEFNEFREHNKMMHGGDVK